eukprot:CAMPEP_0113475008 /NCGR_PEP_ID=MMETSP0014_2-20120614/18892_1 /TAXON_ID=2857 /ORGANISM="Nitzschia sp." /LENGTH=348 /DNA_ID=CAMNT_0000367901 /DNA_START=144 /DNA_END=1190 /DNA_ORIENTATION=+ /assembly_acc=CAM_ASM_000159
MNLVLLVVIIQLFCRQEVVSVAAAVDEECPIDCGPNGVCHEGECLCNTGFAGADCSFPFETCPDGIMQCFGTGATCVPISTREQELEDERQHPANGGRGSNEEGEEEEPRYKCDCSTSTATESPFQITECENPQSQVCEEGQLTSQYAFCTNGGTCVATIRQGMPHAGCHCGNDFEGRHCQYLKGAAPDYELKLAYQEEKNDLDPIIKLWITLVCLGVITAFTLVVYRRRFNTTKTLHPKFLDAAECGPAMYDQNSISRIEVSLTDLPEINSTNIYSGTFVYNDDDLSPSSPIKDVDKTVDCSTETEEDEGGLDGLAQPAVPLSDDKHDDPQQQQQGPGHRVNDGEMA